jgi:hypothetical protein
MTNKPKKPHTWRTHQPGQFRRDEHLRSEQIVPVRARVLRK